MVQNLNLLGSIKAGPPGKRRPREYTPAFLTPRPPDTGPGGSETRLGPAHPPSVSLLSLGGRQWDSVLARDPPATQALLPEGPCLGFNAQQLPCCWSE